MVGQLVQHYRIVGELGRGGMGVVYEAEDTRLGRHVALKFLPERHLSADALERFHREARLASSLSHPHICALHDVGIDADRPFIVMELLEGETIRQRLTGRPLPTDLIIEVGCQLADALDAAHAKGVIHRDIKPANVFLTKRGHAKLLDFGVAKLVAVSKGSQDDVATASAPGSLTNPGVAIGSVHYMSPEQARGEDVDARTDLFSLGLVLYEMATGRQAFEGQTTLTVLDALLREQPPAPRGINPSLPPELERIIVKSMEKDRRLRYQSAADLEADLVRLRRDTSASQSGVIPAPVEKSAPARRVPWKPLVGVALVIAAVASFFVWRSLSAAPLTDKDTILIADFVNKTGDTDFDGTLRTSLTAQLQQSPFFAAISDQTVAETLQFMKQPADTPVVGAVAREICQRTGAKASVEGTIAKVGATYVVTLEAGNCQTGDVLARSLARQAESKEQVLATLESLTPGFRTALGEAAATVRQYDVPLAPATTSSFEAWKVYSLALAARRQGKVESVVQPILQRAVDIDPDFAIAHARLAGAASTNGDGTTARNHATKAYELRAAASEYEQFYITNVYHAYVTRNRVAQKQNLDQAVATFPRSTDFLNSLGNYHATAGAYAAAIPLYERTVELAPTSRLYLGGLVNACALAGEVEKLYELLERSYRLGPGTNFVTVQEGRVYVASVNGDTARLATYLKIVDTTSSTDISEANKARIHRNLALVRGQLREFDDLNRRLLALGGQGAALAQLAANIEALDLNLRRPLRKPLGSASLDKLSDDLLWVLAWAYAFTRDVAMADRLAAEVDRRHTLERPTHLARAAALFAAGHSMESLEALDQEAETAGRWPMVYAFRGRVRQAQGDLAGAREDYQTYLQRKYYNDLPNLTNFVPYLVIQQTQIIAADLAHELGDDAEARRLYNDLLNQWKDADKDYPLLLKVQAGLAKLGK